MDLLYIVDDYFKRAEQEKNDPLSLPYVLFNAASQIGGTVKKEEEDSQLNRIILPVEEGKEFYVFYRFTDMGDHDNIGLFVPAKYDISEDVVEAKLLELTGKANDLLRRKKITPIRG